MVNYFCVPSGSVVSDCRKLAKLTGIWRGRESFLGTDPKEVVCCQLAQALSSKYDFFFFFRGRDLIENC